MNIIKNLIKLPFFKRLIPSVLKIVKKKKIVKVNKFYLNLDCSYSHEREIYIHREYEKDQIFYLDELIKEKNIEYFFDIGSCIGFYSLYLEKNNSNLKEIYSFEVNKLNFQRLKNNFKLNKSKINAYNLGCSDKKTKSKIWYTSTSRMPGTAVLDVDDLEYYKYDKDSLNYANVELVKIDDMFNLKNKLIALKIDVERHEFYVLKGAKTLLCNNNIIMQIEIFPDMEDRILTLLKSYNFKVLKKIKFDYFLCN